MQTIVLIKIIYGRDPSNKIFPGDCIVVNHIFSAMQGLNSLNQLLHGPMYVAGRDNCVVARTLTTLS